MLFKNIAVLDENLQLLENMYVGIKDGKIDYIGKEVPEDTYDYIYGSEIYDGRGKLLMSGFYNTHAHSPMTLMRGYGEGLSLQDWLNKRIFPFEDHLYSGAVYWGTMLSIAESLRSGIVSTTDMYYFCPDMAKAAFDSGAKMNISRSVVHFDDSDPYQSVRFKEMSNFVRDYHMTAMGRVRADMAVHAEYTNTARSIQVGAEMAKEAGVRMQVHLSETKNEHEECKARHGKTPAALMRDLGLFDVPTTAAHCVWLEDEDFDILAEKGVYVSSCPASNMKLASGIANIPEMLKRGVKVTLGTDSVSSNNSLNYFEEMKLLALAAKVRNLDPTALTTDEVLYMATRQGALSQGRDDCGAVAVGNKADLIVIDLDQPNMQPIHDIKSNLIYSASDRNVVLTMVDGKVLYKDGQFTTIDIEKTTVETVNAVNKILGEL